MPFINYHGVRIYKSEVFRKFSDISHFITTRHGGVSKEPYASMNIGFGTDDKPLSVLENRHKLAEALGIPLDYFVMANQVHGTQVQVISKEQRSSGALHKYNAIQETDSMITNEPEICLFVMAADCVPLLFFDPVRKVIGAAHAGWRGTVKKIAYATILRMKDVFHSNPADINAFIGPSIGPCCYKVGREVAEEVKVSFGTLDKFILEDYSQPVLDLWYANKYQLLEAGLGEEHIEVAGICTQCNHEDFYSSRQGNGDTGRFGAGIMLL